MALKGREKRIKFEWKEKKEREDLKFHKPERMITRRTTPSCEPTSALIGPRSGGVHVAALCGSLSASCCTAPRSELPPYSIEPRTAIARRHQQTRGKRRRASCFYSFGHLVRSCSLATRQSNRGRESFTSALLSSPSF